MPQRERPFPVRSHNAELRRRVNANLGHRWGSRHLTSFAALKLVRRYLSSIGLPQRMRRLLDSRRPSSDFGVVAMTTLILALMISGGRRVCHLRYLESTPTVLRPCGLSKLPPPRSVAWWLAQFRSRHLRWLRDLNE